ncbi:ParA family protein [Clostridium estertheticum]|uniref:ParA family protein n=1 Tax=Clostridium estertheticum TaxID=238834 RepID=UPI001CF33F2E|nr:ParA family protein [Clostridium estertheticum]MCB2339955.1 AAA family ATPase [Clostridium estertheticum]
MCLGKIVSIINWKGGVGKTTITHHLATGLQDISLNELKKYIPVDSHPKVLIIDTDPQCNLSISCLGYNTFEKKVYTDKIKTMKELIRTSLNSNKSTINIADFILKKSVKSSVGHVYTFVDLIPSHSDLIYIDMEIAKHNKITTGANSLVAGNNNDIYKFKILHDILENIKYDYDFIFIDCPPNLNYITQNALFESDYYLIPTIPDRLSSYGILSITNKVNDLNKDFLKYDPDYIETKLAGIVLNNVREYRLRPKATQLNIISALVERFPNDLYKNHLTYGDGIVKASALGYPVFSLDGKNANATKQSSLIKEIIKEFLTKIMEDGTK